MILSVQYAEGLNLPECFIFIIEIGRAEIILIGLTAVKI